MDVTLLKKYILDMSTMLSELKDKVAKEEESILVLENNREKLRAKIKEIIQLQEPESTVVFNIRGSKYKIAKSTIEGFHINNELKRLIQLNDDDNKEIIINRNKHYFEIIMKILHTDYSNNSRDREINIVNREITAEGMVLELKYYFFNSSLNQLLWNTRITINNKKVYCEGVNKMIYLSKFICPPLLNHPIQKYLIKDINDINIEGKTFYITKNNSLKLEFNEPITINHIALSPFWGDIECCFPGDGANEVIYGYYYENNLKYFGAIPSIYGSCIDDSYHIVFQSVLVNGLIFMARYNDFSIANIHIG